ncbi:MAG TPA: HAD family hydrolase [Candidatus Limnocylindria bacterium]|nr:HAD family hydrolase [Candidatus Limnocylindria bacterium]
MAARIVWLFDIDGTLLTTDGAARESIAAAAFGCLGVADDLQGIAFAGRTDPLILADILARHGRDFDAASRERFWSVAYAEMAARLTPGRGRVLPGVTELLDDIAREPDWGCAVLTGNQRAMAAIKLRHYGLEDRFSYGAFGDEASDRNALARRAVAHAQDRFGVRAEQCIVVGDTEHDIACARAAQARAVAVATGIRSLSELAAHRPDLLLESLEERQRLLAWARSL